MNKNLERDIVSLQNIDEIDRRLRRMESEFVRLRVDIDTMAIALAKIIKRRRPGEHNVSS